MSPSAVPSASVVMLSAVATSPPALKSSLLSLFDIKLRAQRVRGLSGLAPQKNRARLSAHAHMSAPPSVATDGPFHSSVILSAPRLLLQSLPLPSPPH